MFGLKHPETAEAMQKKTRVQTSSRQMFLALDQRVCSHDHKHVQIAGSCHWRGKTIPLSQFAGNYPKQFAKAIIKGVISCKEGPIICPAYHIEEDEIQEPPAKKARAEYEMPVSIEEDHAQDTTCWEEVFQELQKELPKSGIKTWTNPQHAVFQSVQSRMPELSVGAVKAGKGLERHIAPEAGWEDELPIRQTVLLRRFSSQIEKLSAENWTRLTKAQQRRHAKPSHIMICVFASAQKRSASDGDRPGSKYIRKPIQTQQFRRSLLLCLLIQ